MNIFILDKDPKISAAYHCDKHVVKMITEYNQLLSSAHRILDNNCDSQLMKLTHKNHPCSIWTRTNSANYNYLYQLFVYLSREYQYRYGKEHGSYTRGKNILKTKPKNILESNTITEFPQSMPDRYKDHNTVQAYRNYYIGAKSHFSKWKNRNVPEWFDVVILQQS